MMMLFNHFSGIQKVTYIKLQQKDCQINIVQSIQMFHVYFTKIPFVDMGLFLVFRLPTFYFVVLRYMLPEQQTVYNETRRLNKCHKKPSSKKSQDKCIIRKKKHEMSKHGDVKERNVEQENILIPIKSNCRKAHEDNKKNQKDKINPNPSSFNLFQYPQLKVKHQSFAYHVRATYSHPASIRGSAWSLFSMDVYRTASFANYPFNAAKSPFMLASDGFVYIGNGSSDKVMCFYCGKEKENWRPEDVIEDVHRLMSPNCPKVVSRSQNLERTALEGASNYDITEAELNESNSQVSQSLINYDQVDSLVGITNSTLQTHSMNRNVNHEQNVDNGSAELLAISTVEIQTPIQHVVTNETLSSSHFELMQININGSSSSSHPVVPDARHHRNSANPSDSQVLVNQTDTTSSVVDVTRNNQLITAQPTYSDLNIITDRPKRPEYALKIKRIQSFDSWPRYHHLTPDELAEAGFYFAGYGDCTRCFYCGGGLRNWDEEDDVWVEHARWFPRCSYLKQKLGEDFVEIVQDLHLQHEQITLADVQVRLENHSGFLNEDTNETLLRHDPAVLALVCLGFNQSDVIQIASVLKQEDNLIAADSLLDKLIAEGKQKTRGWVIPYASENVEIDLQRFRVLKERNNQIRQQIMCKICLDNDVSVVFLPCGHLVSCADCASAMRNCPVCRSNVRGITRALIS
ncbi:Baculoviral IAP repeat-containing protein 7 [Bulinus truncatus]|nr:Baculoviral IAP repeat-containing protein 7 [Bulinus truncatus]